MHRAREAGSRELIESERKYKRFEWRDGGRRRSFLNKSYAVRTAYIREAKGTYTGERATIEQQRVAGSLSVVFENRKRRRKREKEKEAKRLASNIRNIDKHDGKNVEAGAGMSHSDEEKDPFGNKSL